MAEKKFNLFDKVRTIKRPTVGQMITWGVGLVLAIALLIFLRGFVACWTLTGLAGMPPAGCSAVNGTVVVNPEGTPIATGDATPTLGVPQVELPPPWDGASRVTVLFIGLDYRDWEAGQGPPRSDTLMLLTIDPISKTAGMLSIPRDLWVNIPGFSYGKINTAYALGEAYRLPGGGPALSVKTVESVIGVPIQYYVWVDFNIFVRLIDEIGGVDITPAETIEIDPIGPGDDHETLRGGVPYTLRGSWALAYARNRKTEGGDVDRARRQQEVIMAIRARLLEPGNWPMLISKVPTLYEELSSGIHTNMPLEDALQLAQLALSISPENISRGVIDETMVTFASVVVNGQELSVDKPITDKIRLLRDQIFTPGGALSSMANEDPVMSMQTEGARLAVLNGTYTPGLAAETGDYLTAQGMNVVTVGNPSQFPGHTLIIDHSGKPYTVAYLMSLMHLDNSQLQIRFDPAAEVDIEIILGDDWATNNPMP